MFVIAHAEDGLLETHGVVSWAGLEPLPRESGTMKS